MLASGVYSGYDPLAWFYEKYWSFHRHVIPLIEGLVLPQIPGRARILDLCCGTGDLSLDLSNRGHLVTGLDSSRGMLFYARQKAPDAWFVEADARDFCLPDEFHACVSVFDSMNHILSRGELATVFRNVHAALMGGGVFFFDLNMEEAYRRMWGKSHSFVEEDNVCIISGGYDPETRTGTTRITLFRLEGQWVRTDLALVQRCHSVDDAVWALKSAGFGEIRYYDAGAELEMKGDYGVGRGIFLAKKA